MSIGPIDSHAHLSQPAFDLDREEVINRAKEKGIKAILSIGTDFQEIEKELKIAKGYPGFISLGIGFHPHIAKQIHDKDYDILQDIAKQNSEVLAIGETGLDYYYKNSDPESQQRAFKRHLRLSQNTSLPVIIHCRNAYDDLIKIVNTEDVNPCKVLIHCFSGDIKHARVLIKWGATLSFAGPVTYPNAERLRKVVSITPLDRILIETDSPYLSPQKFRGKRNEPAYVLEAYKVIAGLKDIQIEELFQQVAKNFFNLFNKPQVY